MDPRRITSRLNFLYRIYYEIATFILSSTMLMLYGIKIYCIISECYIFIVKEHVTSTHRVISMNK